ncbi:MAG: hypothetical protein ABSH06_25460 [Thermodesulfobacteriota bacterium]|jgi:hypothetical protein
MKWFKFNALPIFLFVGLAANVFLVCSSLAEEQKTKVQTWDTSNSANKELIKQLDSTDPNIRFKAIMKLGLARDSAAIEPLARLRELVEGQTFKIHFRKENARNGRLTWHKRLNLQTL